MNDTFHASPAPQPPPRAADEVNSLGAARLTSRELDQMALGLHAQGKTYRQIAQDMNISRSGAHTRVQRCLARYELREEDLGAALRQQALIALQQGVGAVATAAAQGDSAAFRDLLQFANISLRLVKVRDTRRWAKRINRRRLGDIPLPATVSRLMSQSQTSQDVAPDGAAF